MLREPLASSGPGKLIGRRDNVTKALIAETENGNTAADKHKGPDIEGAKDAEERHSPNVLMRTNITPPP